MNKRGFYSTGTGSFLALGEKIQGKRKTFKRSDTSVLTSSHVNGWIPRGEDAPVKHSPWFDGWCPKEGGSCPILLYKTLGRKLTRHSAGVQYSLELNVPEDDLGFIEFISLKCAIGFWSNHFRRLLISFCQYKESSLPTRFGKHIHDFFSYSFCLSSLTQGVEFQKRPEEQDLSCGCWNLWALTCWRVEVVPHCLLYSWQYRMDMSHGINTMCS